MATPLSRVLLAACTALGPLAAQEWQIPVHGAAVYERTFSSKRAAEPANYNPGGLWGSLVNGGVVLHSDLDKKGERIDRPWLDARDALAWACMDLSVLRKKKVKYDLPGGNRFADCVLEVEFSAMDDAGRQELAGVIVQDKKAAPARAMLSGTVRGERVVDEDNGLVKSLKGTLELVVQSSANGAAGKVTFTIEDDWAFDRVIAHDDPEFRVRVAKAIGNAVDALERELRRKIGQEPRKTEDPFHDHQAGDLALLLLAMVKGSEDPEDELIQQGYEKLRTFPMSGTYSLSVAILAMEALYTPPGEFRALRDGTIDKPMERKLSDRDRALVEKWATALLENIDTTVDKGYIRRWHYGPSTHWDNSNCQYALLGIYAAQLCGVEITPAVWHTAAQHWLEVLLEVGKPSAASLVTHQERDRQKDRGGRGTVTRGRKVQPVGWAYYATGEPTGSMTCAGLTGLTLCHTMMRSLDIGTREQRKAMDAAIRGGFVWLAENLDVRSNPGPLQNRFNWIGYYLYGLERTCELNQIALLGDRDWYFDGAMQLLAQQRKNGSWGGDWDTAFGLLFLKKSALPAFTGK